MLPISEFRVIEPSEVTKQVITHCRVAQDYRANLTTDFLKILMSTGQMPVPSSPGSPYQEYRLMTEAEMIDRAVTTVELLYETAERKGWMQEVPSIDALLVKKERAGF